MIRQTVTSWRRLPYIRKVPAIVFTILTMAIAVMHAGVSASNAATSQQAAGIIEEMRAAIQASHERDGSGPYEALVPFLADQVETVHQPAFPNDGMVDRAPLAKFLEIEHRLHDVAIKNRRMDVSFTVAGNGIVMKGVMTGELHDGRALMHPIHVMYRVESGKIVRFWIDASTPEVMEGYRLQREAFMCPEARPLLDEMRAAMPRE